MKTHLVKTFSFAMIVMSAISCSNSSKLEKTTKQNSVIQWVSDQNFVFHVQNAQSGRVQVPIAAVLSNYTFTVSKDSVISYLPYFGQAWRAPVNPNDGGIKFNSTKFDYTSKTVKKGWEVSITPKDLSAFSNTEDVRKIWLHIGENGYGQLQMVAVNRDPITFFGYIDTLR